MPSDGSLSVCQSHVCARHFFMSFVRCGRSDQVMCSCHCLTEQLRLGLPLICGFMIKLELSGVCVPSAALECIVYPDNEAYLYLDSPACIAKNLTGCILFLSAEAAASVNVFNLSISCFIGFQLWLEFFPPPPDQTCPLSQWTSDSTCVRVCLSALTRSLSSAQPSKSPLLSLCLHKEIRWLIS